MTGDKTFLAIDVGGTYIKSAVLNAQGEVLMGSPLSVDSYSGESQEKILSSFNKTISNGQKIILDAGLKLDGIGLAFPGPFDYNNGIPLMKHKFNNIYGLKLGEFIRKMQGIPANLPIRFVHDTSAVLAGELWKGNAKGFQEAAVVTLGTGLGFAFSREGKVQIDPLGSPLVSIYKLPFKEGILEDYTARRGFLKIYREYSDKSIEGMDVEDIGNRASEGDEHCVKTFNKVGSILAEVLRNILVEKDIQCLLFGGQISRSFKHLEESLIQSLGDVKCLRRISPVKNIDNAPLFGSLRAILDNKSIT